MTGRLLAVFLILWFIGLNGQEPMSFEKVVYDSDSSASMEDMFERSRKWFSNAFNSGESVIDLEDKENGVIIGKASFQYEPSKTMLGMATGRVDYKVTVYCKEARSKIIVSDFYHTSTFIKSDNFGNMHHQCSFGLIYKEAEQETGCPKMAFTKKTSNSALEEIRAKSILEASYLFETFEESVSGSIEIDKGGDW